MFSEHSRYKNVPVVTVPGPLGTDVSAVKLRVPGSPPSHAAPVTHGDQLDVISQQRFGDAARYWHIADANTELEARSLTQEAGRRIRTPERG